jgi:hypothetical protein
MLTSTLGAGNNNSLILGRTNATNDAFQMTFANVGVGSTTNYLGFNAYGSTYTAALAIQAGGYVGIGTTNPSSLLTVGDGTNTGATPLGVYNIYNGTGGAIIQNLSTGTAAVSSLALGDSANNNRGGIALFGSGYTASAQYRTGGTYVYNNIAGGVTIHAEAANSNVYIATAGSERMRITSAGNVGIGTPSPSQALQVAGNIQMGTQSADYKQFILGGGNSFGYLWGQFNKYGDAVTLSYNYYNNGSNQFYNGALGTSRITCYYNKVEIGATAVAGTEATAGVQLTDRATSWTTFSDARMKDVIEPISNAVSKVDQISTVIFKFKNDDTRRVGVIAQDIREVLPEAVDQTEDMLGVRYTELIPLALAAIKELSAQNKVLEQSLATATTNVSSLEDRLAALEAKLNSQ